MRVLSPFWNVHEAAVDQREYPSVKVKIRRPVNGFPEIVIDNQSFVKSRNEYVQNAISDSGHPELRERPEEGLGVLNGGGGGGGIAWSDADAR